MQDGKQLFEDWFKKDVEPRYEDNADEIRRRFEMDVSPTIGALRPDAVAQVDVIRIV